MTTLIAWLYWDPSKEAFTIPIIDRPIAWYGILFVLGFILSYFIIIPVFARFLQKIKTSSCEQAIPEAIEPIEQTAQFLTDRLCWFIVLGTLIGARLGAVFFYDWDFYSAHPIEIFKVWKGGLASHGGTVGVIIAICLFRLQIRKRIPSLTFLDIMDCVAVPTALAGCFIRLGNFVNQEILGTPTDLPWAVIFGHPIDESVPMPRHPVQLYEALAYFAIFVFLYFLWKKKASLSRGMLSGLLLILIFSSRFILEFWKENMESIIETSSSSIQMGQWLSLPFIAFGFYLIWYGKHYPSKNKHNRSICT